MANENNHNELGRVFTNTDHLTMEILQGYQEGTLAPEEVKLVEHHLVDCELCSEAIEGFEGADMGSVSASVKDLNEQIGAITGSRQTTIVPMGRTQLIAASIAIVAIVGVGLMINMFFSGSDTNQMAQALEATESEDRPEPMEERNTLSLEEEPLMKEQKEDVERENPEVDKNMLGSGLTDATDKIDVPIEEDEELAVEEEVTTDRDISYEWADDAKVKEEVFTTNGATTIQPASSTTKTIESMELQSTKDRKGKRSKTVQNYAPAMDAAEVEIVENSKKSDSKRSDMQKGREAYAAGKYNDAIRQFKKVLKKNESSPEANYYTGAAYLNSGYATQAMPFLNTVTETKTNPYYQSGLWLKSLAFIQNNQKANAKMTLERIVREGGRFKDRAAKRLETLE